jgi:uncharacterized protein (TIGR02246 family)
VSPAEPRHPSDAEREREAIEVLERCLRAAAEEDEEALAACYAEDAVWLEEGGIVTGARAVARRHLALAGGARWDPPQQHGSKAVLRYRREVAIGYVIPGAIVVEARRGRIVFAAVL